MTKSSENKIQLFSSWCGVFYMVAVLVGWGLIAGFLPPHHPSAGVKEIVDILTADYQRIRIGMIFLMFAALLAIPFAARISQVVGDVEGRPGVLVYSALLGGAGLMVLTFYPAVWWLVAVYRPDRPAELMYLMNDGAWLQFVGGVSIFIALPVSITVASFCDDNPDPVFPRWAGYLNIWVVLIMLPDQLLFFFHTGPFAYNGLIAFWIPLALLGGWLWVTFHLLRKDVLRRRTAVAKNSILLTAAN